MGYAGLWNFVSRSAYRFSILKSKGAKKVTAIYIYTFWILVQFLAYRYYDPRFGKIFTISYLRAESSLSSILSKGYGLQYFGFVIHKIYIVMQNVMKITVLIRLWENSFKS